MKITVISNGIEHEVELTDAQLTELLGDAAVATAYDRVQNDNNYCWVSCDGTIENDIELHTDADNACYDAANYWNDESVAETDARADTLMRKLRRYSMMHGGYGMPDEHWTYKFNRANSTVFISNSANDFPIIGQITFFSWDDARNALVMHRDDIEWYFREYLPSKEV